MTKLLPILMAVALWIGCEPWFEDPVGPSKGPEGQPLEVYQGKDSAGNRIEYQFYLRGDDTTKHGEYYVFYEDEKMEKSLL